MITLRELNSLQIGDYVTHIDHGIGKFGGLQKLNVQGKNQEALEQYQAALLKAPMRRTALSGVASCEKIAMDQT